MASVVISILDNTIPNIGLQVYGLGYEMWKETEYSRFEWDEGKSRAVIDYTLNECSTSDPKVAGWGMFETVHYTLVGMLFVSLRPPYFSRDCILHDAIFYVHPNWRGTKYPLIMMEHAEGWGRAKGAREIHITSSSMPDHSKYRKVFARKGYTENAVTMAKTL
jgi:GNAT superfamily N-acetyltransferase